MLYSLILFIRLLKIDWKIAFRKVLHKLKQRFLINRQRKSDLNNKTFLPDKYKLDSIDYAYYTVPTQRFLKIYEKQILSKTQNLMEHKFEFLGSGLTHVYHGFKNKNNQVSSTKSEKFVDWESCLSERVSKENYQECLNISKSIDSFYTPIDWQLDFKSGFRWDEKQWYKDLKYGDIFEADIKIPWELGRMQSIISLVYSSVLEKKEGITNDKYSYEFKNQVLGFITLNPPKHGVQWISPMDAAIRLSNWLVCYDLFKSNDIIFDIKFVKIFTRSINEHVFFILENLEWSSGLRGNHYMANIAGLLYAAAYLPINEETTSWLVFAIQELLNEIEFQFNDDGSNFEGSISYHFLTTEIVMHSVALVLALPNDKIKALKSFNSSKWKYERKIEKSQNQKYRISEESKITFQESIWEKLHRISIFSFAVSNSKGDYPNFGDDDSGRFLILTPQISKGSINSDMRIPLSIYGGIIDLEIITKNNNAIFPFFPIFEYSIVRNLLINRFDGKAYVDEDDYEQYCICENVEDKITIVEKEEVKLFSFTSFGIYVYQSNNYNFQIKCGNIGQRGKGGHDHNDQLSFAMDIQDKAFFIDPGTFQYTSNPKMRNEYRSVFKHNTLGISGEEQNKWDTKAKDDLFWLKKLRTKSKCLESSDTIFVGEQYSYAKPHKRIISFTPQKIDATDLCELNKAKVVSFHLHPDVNIVKDNDSSYTLKFEKICIKILIHEVDSQIKEFEYSPNYGTVLKSNKIVVNTFEEKVKWSIELIDLDIE